MYRLIIADDEEHIRSGMQTCVQWEAAGISVVGTAATGRETLELIRRTKPDVAIVDVNMPDMTGLEVIDAVRRDGACSTVFLILSGYDQFTYVQHALQLRVDNYLLKPCRPEELLDAVAQALQRREEKPGEQFYGNYAKWLEAPRQEQEMISRSAQERLQLSLRRGSEEKALEAAASIFAGMKEQKPDSGQFLQACRLLYADLYRTLQEFNGDTLPLTDFFEEKAEANAELMQTERDFMEAVRLVCRCLRANTGPGNAVLAAAEYIQDHYAEPFGLEDVAEHVGVSAPYLSGLFRQVLGMNFVDFVNKTRIQAAKKMLDSGVVGNGDIAAAVGFSSEKYFSRVFKKYAGMTASEYRRRSGSCQGTPVI